MLLAVRTSRVILAIAGVLSFAPPRPADSAEYRSPRWHYQLQIPDGWSEIDPERIKAINADAQARLPGQQTLFETGFVPDSSADGDMVYALVQIQPGSTKGLSYESLEKDLSAGAKAVEKNLKKAVEDVFDDIEVGNFTLNREKAIFVSRQRMHGEGGMLTDLATGHLGANAIVTIHAYSPAPEFGKVAPTFAVMNDSFAWDEGEAFKPAPSRAEAIGRLAGVIGGVIGGLLAVFLVRQFRKTRAASE